MNFQFNSKQQTYSSLPGVFFEETNPVSVSKPKLVLWNDQLADSFEIASKAGEIDERSLIFSGNQIIEGSKPIAQAYAGHQFGHFTMLGDGRAHLLGELEDSKGVHFDIALKGSGRTSFSRRGDGRAALGPMIREYILSEAMHALKIPTTRSLAVVETGEMVEREEVLPGAILTRVASSHLRVGTFEFAAMKDDLSILQSLLDYAIHRHDPDLKQSSNPALSFLEAVSNRQAKLMCEWMRVGFIHGVMNTDNTTISGETIDYGPCAFMDHYQSGKVYSSIDRHGRYAFNQQPAIMQWNLARLGETLIPLIDSDQKTAIDKATKVVQEFKKNFEDHWLRMMKSKLGLMTDSHEDLPLCVTFLEILEKEKLDFTNTFRKLSFIKNHHEISESQSFRGWFEKWNKRRIDQPSTTEQSAELMNQSNPCLIPRNHLVEEALGEAKKGDLSKANHLIHLLKDPYLDSPEKKDYQKPPKPEEEVRATFCGT